MTQVLSCKIKDENPFIKAHFNANLLPTNEKYPPRSNALNLRLNKGLPMKALIPLFREERS
jgi:hypothetical protein